MCLVLLGDSSSHSKIFHSCGDVIIACQVLQILTSARQSCPLRFEGSLACHTYCDTGQSFIMVITEEWRGSVTPTHIAKRLAVKLLSLTVFTI